MLAGSEYLTSNTAIAYPFVDNAPGLMFVGPGLHGPTAQLPSNCFVDASIAAPHTAEAVYLTNIVGTFTTARGVIFYIPGTPAPSLFQASIDTAPLNPLGGAGYFTRIELIATHTVTGQEIPMKFTVVSEALYNYLVPMPPASVADFQQRLPFEAKTIFREPKRVQTLELYSALPPIPEPDEPGPIVGDVKLVSGYNIAQVVTGDEVELSAVPGTGAGLAPCQHTTPTVYKQFMATTPDDAGNVQLVSGEDQCYTIVPHSDGTFEIQGGCTAGCACQDYANITKALENLFKRAKVIYDRLELTRKDPDVGFEIGVTKYNQLIFPLYGQPVLAVNGMSGKQWSIEGSINTGAPHFATFTATVQNNTSYPAVLNTLDLAFVCVPAATPVIRHVAWECSGNGGKLPLTFPVAPGYALPRGARYSVYVSVAHPQWNVAPAWTVTATATVQVQHPVTPYTVTLGPVVCNVT